MVDASIAQGSTNPYFHDKRIRRNLIETGLINKRGNILPKTTYEIILAERVKPKHTKARPLINLTNYVIEDEKNHRFTVHKEPNTNTGRSRGWMSTRSQQQHYMLNISTRNDGNRRNESVRPLTARSPKRSVGRMKSMHRSPTNVKTGLVQRSASTKIPNDQYCRVTMIYYGSQLNHDRHRSNDDEIIIMQQYSNEENLLVFKGFITPNEIFTFESCRHPDYPFVLSLYINSYIDSRISVCCENKYKDNVRLCGSRGSFGIYSVQKSKPCSRCIFEEYKKKVVSPSTNTTTHSRTRSVHKTLSPASKGNVRCLLNSVGKEETSKSRRNYAPKKTTRRSKTLGRKSSSSPKRKKSNNLTSNSMITLETKLNSYNVDRQLHNSRKISYENSLNSREESRPSTPMIPNGYEYYRCSSQSLYSSAYGNNQQLTIQNRPFISPLDLSDNDEHHSINEGSFQNDRHRNSSRQSTATSPSNTSKSTSIPTFSYENDSITAKQYSLSPSSLLSLSNEEQNSNSSDTIGREDNNRQNVRLVSLPSTQSSVDRICEELQYHKLPTSMTHDKHTDLKTSK
ncbi:unnamed protein product [Adineta ricciae]|uniref:DUF4590 domain-containing protein n=1 Tax=Adineta ricciae TaxID=249248 RepID=A0A813VQD2_ADIRI|nr:unnamed protein product [Adineta ricciae]